MRIKIAKIKINMIKVVFGLLGFAAISFINSKAVLCSNTDISFSQNGVSTWKDEDSKIEEKFQVYRNECKFQLDATKVEADYDQIVLNMSADGLFELNEKDQLSFIYQYKGEKPIYLNLGICNMNGKQYRLKQEFTYAAKTEKGITLYHTENGSVELKPGSIAEIILPLNCIEDLKGTVEDCYGFSAIALIQKQDICDCSISKINFLSGEDSINLDAYQNISLEGDELVFVPEMGNLWIDYHIVSDNPKDVTFQANEYDNHCVIDKNGRLYLTSDTTESQIKVMIKTAEGYSLSKDVTVVKLADFKGVYVTPEEKIAVRPAVSGLMNIQLHQKISVSFLIGTVLLVLLFMIIEIYIWRMERRDRMEEEEL